MKNLPVSGSAWPALVDDRDFKSLSGYRWCLTNGYVSRSLNRGDERKTLYLHREILKPPGGLEVDHVNRNKLDNRRENLRVVTHQQNQQNLPPKGGRSRFHGVSWDRSRKRWLASARLPDGTRWQRRFDDEFAAALAVEAIRYKHQTHAPPDPALGVWTVVAHHDSLRLYGGGPRHEEASWTTN